MAAKTARTISTFSCDIAYSRKPGGFEGLVEREVGVPTNDLAVLERVDEGDVLLNLHVPSPHALTSQLNDSLAAVDDLQDLGAEFIPLTGPVAKCLDHPVVPPIRLGVRQFGWLIDQHLRVEVDEQRPKVAISDGGEIRGDGQGLPHDLHVLLRHRRRSISRFGGGGTIVRWFADSVGTCTQITI